MENKYNLPQECFGVLASTGETILIKFGEKGYYPQESLKWRNAHELNEEIFGITDKAISMAMQMGSMFGWDVPATNPDTWREKVELYDL